MDTSRRHILQLLGLSAAALATPPVLDALAAGPPAAEPTIGPAKGALTAKQWAMVIDTRKFKSEADVERARELLDSAHKGCLVSNSITSAVKVFPDFRVSPATA